jgi:hypothetical protein
MKYNEKVLTFMKKLAYIFIIAVLLFASGCAAKETKYASVKNPEMYIVFHNDEGKTAFYHSVGVENYKGTWAETDTDYTFFVDDGSSLVFQKMDDGSIGMKLNSGNVSVYKKV